MPANFECKPIEFADIDSLGQLMDISYRGTIDHRGESLDQCIQAMRDTINGKYGPFIYQASFVMTLNDQIASAIMLTEWKGQPLVAEIMSDKKFQGKGLAKFLLARSISALVPLNWQELFLVVTEGNTAAEKLYEAVGFTSAGRALPGTAPPAA